MEQDFMKRPWSAFVQSHPAVLQFTEAFGLTPEPDESMEAYLARQSDAFFSALALQRDQVAGDLLRYLDAIQSRCSSKQQQVKTMTIVGGTGKDGTPENLSVTVNQGEIVCVVGPTGSGKSRLLADVECLAQGDTPTRRRVQINGTTPTQSQRYAAGEKLVAQLSQNMQFIMDMQVDEFLILHAKSRMLDRPEQMANAIWEAANALAGETFGISTPLCNLSGGQSRALMIADTALLSHSPIVLIDELENAGIDREQALDLLVKKEKVVLMSTHDPVLALLGQKRIVMEGGIIKTVLQQSELERENLPVLQAIDRQMVQLRGQLRAGTALESNIATELMQRLASIISNEVRPEGGAN